MLKLVIPETEFFDERKNEFVYVKEKKLSLEHSLVSVSKWESKYKRSFLNDGPKTIGELIDYVKCMTITQNVDPLAYDCLTQQSLNEIQKYIDDPMTATTFSDNSKEGLHKKREVVTSELVYYWMFTFGIAKECEKWHFNRLLALINICSIKNGPQQKMGKQELAAYNRSLNAARKKKLGTKG